MRLPKVMKQTRRGKSRHVVDWEGHDGKRHQPVFATKDAAEAKRYEVEQSLRRTDATATLPPDLTTGQLFERWIASHPVKPRTRASYQELWDEHWKPAFGVTPVAKLTRFQVREFLKQKLTTHSRNTVRLLHATLHVMLEEAAEDGLVAVNVTAGLAKRLRLGTSTKARRERVGKKAMTRTERDRFLATAERLEPWWAPAWTVQVLTGLRPGELYALEEADLDLTARTLRVARTLPDDGDPEGIGTPKNGLERPVDLTNEAVRVLRAHLTRRREDTLRRGWRELPRPLFCSTAGTYADPAGVREAFRRVCKAAGITGKSPHSLRHTYASLHLQAGTADMYYLQRMMGHADVSLTVNTYGSAHQPDRPATLDALDRQPAEQPSEAQA